MTRAVLSLGSNLGDRAAHLRTVVADLGAAVVAVSPVFETAPWGVTDQPDGAEGGSMGAKRSEGVGTGCSRMRGRRGSATVSNATT